MLISKLGIFISADPNPWIIYKLKSKKILILMVSTKKCLNKEKTTDFGFNLFNKKIHHK